MIHVAALRLYLCRLRHHERGAEVVEYAILLMLIALLCITGVALIGEDTAEFYSETASGLG